MNILKVKKSLIKMVKVKAVNIRPSNNESSNTSK